MIPFICVTALVLLDQIVKHLVSADMTPFTLIPGIIQVTYLENRGAAFGIMQDKSVFLIVVPMIIVIGLIYFYTTLGKTRDDKFTKIALILIIAGAIGNLIDRAMAGFVVDMFNFIFIDFPVFNVADICVVIGTIFLIIASFFVNDKE